MDKNKLIDELNTVEFYKDYLKKFSRIENYKKGQIIKSTEDIKVISILVKGSVRQIDKINGRETTRYKYIKNDFLFINNLYGAIKNKSKFVASEESILLSIDIEKFKNDLKNDKKLRDWIESTNFKCEYINFIAELFKNYLLSNQEISNLFLELKNNSIILNFQKISIDEESKKRINSHLLYSLSNNNEYKYGEKISFKKDDKLPTLNRVILINSTKLKYFNTYLVDQEKKSKTSDFPDIDRSILNKKNSEINNDKKNQFKNSLFAYKNSNIKKKFSLTNQDNLKFPEYISNQDLGEYLKNISLRKGNNEKENILICFENLCQLMNIVFREEVISNYLNFVDSSKKGFSYINYAEIANGLSLDVSYGKVSKKQALSLKTPSLIIYKGKLALALNSDNYILTINYPPEGIVSLSINELDNLYEENISILNLSKRRTTPQNNFSVSWFIPILKNYKNTLFYILITGLIVQLFALSNPLLIQVIIDKVITQRSLDTLQILGFALFTITILESVLASIKSFILTETTNRIDQKLGSIIIDHLFRLPLEYFDKRPVGELANRISELEKIRNFLTSQGISSILDVLFAFIYIFILFVYSAQLALVALSVVPIQILIIIYGSPIFRTQHRDAAVDNAETQSYLVETVSGIQTIKTQNAETSSRWKWQNFYSKFISSSYKRNVTAISLNQITSVLQKISQLIVIWVGASMVLKGELTLGQLIAFRIIAGYVTQPILRLSSIWQQYQEIKISFERLGDIVNTSREDDSDDLGKIQLPEVSGNIVFNDVSFSFTNNASPNLNSINCELESKSFVGIVGKSGSGKSTFCKLISRLYDPTNGRIFIDGFDINKVQLSSLRRQIGIVSQDPLLFSGTIMENITFGDSGFSESAIIETAKICMAHDFIMELPLGYNTQITERGTTLSGGQRQRIAIIRALVKNPKILILDEATSALDTETESLFIKNLLEKRKSTTILMITHRLFNIKKADKILLFDQGYLCSQGKHEDLLEKDLIYSSLYKNV